MSQLPEQRLVCHPSTQNMCWCHQAEQLHGCLLPWLLSAKCIGIGSPAWHVIRLNLQGWVLLFGWS